MIAKKRTAKDPISLLIVDDSLVFRRFLEDIFSDQEDFIIVGEAQNGIEALELILRVKPDVILLDLEMPLMDGQTTLQHLMIHRPTPTIVFSSLTSEGTARCFDTLKNGALDFVCKDFIFKKKELKHKRRMLIDKVRNCAEVVLRAREPVMTRAVGNARSDEVEKRVVFCEDCGHREVVNVSASQPLQNVICSNCGDQIDMVVSSETKHRKNSSLTVFGGGEGSFFNLLEIIPKLDANIGGAVLIVVQQELEHVKEFTEYLDAISPMNIIQARDGLQIETGSCYILAGCEHMAIKPYSTQVTIQKFAKGSSKDSIFDILLASASTIYKEKSAGVVLSGYEENGDLGMNILLKNGGKGFTLDSTECFAKNSVHHVQKTNDGVGMRSTPELIKWIKEL